MHIEDSISRPKVPDYIKYCFGRILQITGNGAHAEIEAMIWTLGDVNKSLEAVDGAQHTVYTTIAARWNTGIMRMASHLDFVFRSYRDNLFQKVGDSFPEQLRRERSMPCKRSI
jgi:hypothetical protein